MLQTVKSEYGPIETGANALLSNRSVETLFADLELPFAERRPARKKRFIFHDGEPRRWPLDFNTSAKLAWRGARLMMGDRNLRPLARESIATWATASSTLTSPICS